MTNVEKFLERLRTDSDLQMKLKSAQEIYTGSREYREAAAKAILLPLAEELGLPFTIDELREYDRELAKRADGAELSPGELKTVHGGLSAVNCFILGVENDGDEYGFCTGFGNSSANAKCIFLGED